MPQHLLGNRGAPGSRREDRGPVAPPPGRRLFVRPGADASAQAKGFPGHEGARTGGAPRGGGGPGAESGGDQWGPTQPTLNGWEAEYALLRPTVSRAGFNLIFLHKLLKLRRSTSLCTPRKGHPSNVFCKRNAQLSRHTPTCTVPSCPSLWRKRRPSACREFGGFRGQTPAHQTTQLGEALKSGSRVPLSAPEPRGMRSHSLAADFWCLPPCLAGKQSNHFARQKCLIPRLLRQTLEQPLPIRVRRQRPRLLQTPV